MFVIHTQSPFTETKTATETFFLNDTKDVIDILNSTNITNQEIEYINQWLSNASFHQHYKSNNVQIFCLPDNQTRKMAAFYGVQDEFEKQYGSSVS